MAGPHIPGLSPVDQKCLYEYRDPIKPTRPFGLQTAPTLYPTEHEFHDPYAFIESHKSLGLKYGILKIVPPVSWRPPFALDATTFRFDCRKQSLSAMGGLTRTVADFLNRLEKFHNLRGDDFDMDPYLDKDACKLPVNYYWLDQAVRRLGGYDRVTHYEGGGGWAHIRSILNYPNAEEFEEGLRSLYVQTILPYVKYVEGAQDFIEMYQDIDDNKKEENDENDDETDIEEGEESKPDIKYPRLVVKRPRAVRLKLNVYSDDDSGFSDSGSESTSSDPDDSDSDSEADNKRRKRRKRDVPAPSRRSARIKSLHSQEDLKEDDAEEPQDSNSNCIVCQTDSTDLKCTQCSLHFHSKCLKRTLYVNRFATKWYCPFCIVGDGMFVFDQGGNYTLQEFQKIANSFHHRYMAANIPPNDPASMESALEEKFWSHVSDLNCTLAVEYGADIRCDLAGSGFPTNVIKNEINHYSADPWNLNNFAHDRMSLLRHLRSNISGVTVPWAYVGMLFSAFCWHSEDHYTYSLNYQHFGATKTWYGIPGPKASEFEKVGKSLVPDLFEKQPHILYQRSTLIPPDVLRTHGVPVYAVDQHAGEFVVTFPNAYHAGFNQGFNFNEAVNFAPLDWLPDGEQAVADLKFRKKEPVFSHEELLLRIAQFETDPLIMYAIYPRVRQIIMSELQNRNRIAQYGVKIEKPRPYNIQKDEQYQCSECKCLCLLSRIAHINEDSERVVYCHEHVPPELLKDSASLSLETSYGADNLVEILQELLARYEKSVPRASITY